MWCPGCEIIFGYEPGVYAVVGAASFAAGATRAISTAVIVTEVTGQPHLLLPISLGMFKKKKKNIFQKFFEKRYISSMLLTVYIILFLSYFFYHTFFIILYFKTQTQCVTNVLLIVSKNPNVSLLLPRVSTFFFFFP